MDYLISILKFMTVKTVCILSFLVFSSASINQAYYKTYQLEKKEIMASFEKCCKSNLVYIFESQEPAVNYDAFISQFKKELKNYSYLVLNEIKYLQIDEIIYPIYAYQMSISMTFKEGLVSSSFMVSMILERN